MTQTERRQRKREETGKLQGTRNPGDYGRGGEKGVEGVPEPSSDGKSSRLNFKVDGLDISQAAVWGMEQHHPIMDKLGDHGGRTYRHMCSRTLL